MGFDAQRFVQRDGLEVFDSHFGCDGDHVAEFVEFAHGVVEDGGNDPAMAVAGRPGVAPAQAKMRDEMLALAIQRKLQMHAMRIIFAAGEAQVLFAPMRFAPVPNCRSLSDHRAEFYPTRLKPIRLKYYLRHFGVRG